ncbi:N-formylglutamate deformylase [Govanella unica]|uniref:N-formylglutamate deformylase n=1 Tax=Govanella unica TaxID=2975056 RepID=A0A9X3Z5S1_9PROT|nr:N-formylglutamate deformylase [Govania unica]MDA5192421.1 N-formylglutamate deformylase [Govania unica]
MTPLFEFEAGTEPLLISIPHAGTDLTPGLAARLTPTARALPDTDWFVDRLYTVARELGASILKANYARVVVDLNRPADGASLYPGQRETGLCPVINFDGTPLYLPGAEPDAAECANRLTTYWQPYHDKIAETLAGLKASHGRAILWDAHSIRSEVPGLFEGRLPDFNLGTGNGSSCPQALAARLLAVAQSAKGYSAVLNGRFKGGHITRHYGQPESGIIAVQLELAQSTYMTETAPHDWLDDRAKTTQSVIRRLLETVLKSGL